MSTNQVRGGTQIAGFQANIHNHHVVTIKERHSPWFQDVIFSAIHTRSALNQAGANRTIQHPTRDSDPSTLGYNVAHVNQKQTDN